MQNKERTTHFVEQPFIHQPVFDGVRQIMCLSTLVYFCFLFSFLGGNNFITMNNCYWIKTRNHKM